MRKRSAYKPKPINPLAHAWVVVGMQPVNEAEEAMRILRKRNSDAATNLQMGRATVQDLDLLANAINMSFALIELAGRKLGSDWMTELEAAADAIYGIACRKGNYIARGPELSAISWGMDIHEAQLDQTHVRLFEKALALEQNAYNTGRGRRVPQEETV